MAKTDFKTIDEYQVNFPEEVVIRMEEIREIIHDAIPDVEETISYQIPCFKFHGYLLYYSAYKNHISLSYPYSEAFRNHFKKQLANYKVSKSAIQIPHSIELPRVFIKEIIQFRKTENLKNSED